MREYAQRRKFTVVREYVDQVTGNLQKRKRNRQHAYDELLSDARRRRFDGVLVWKYDRFARSLVGLVDALGTFAALDIAFISLTEQVDTTTPQGRLFYAIVAGFAEYERELITERVRAGLQNAVAKGVTLGRPRDLSIEAKVVKWAERGLSLAGIAAKVGRSRTGVLKILRRTGIRETPACTKPNKSARRSSPRSSR